MNDEHDKQRERGRRWAWAAFLLFVLPVSYVLSYAPMVRWFGKQVTSYSFESGGLVFTMSHHGLLIRDGRNLVVYRPVDWLISNTPLHDPLMTWAEFNGVKFHFAATHAEQTRADYVWRE